jgi:hypothetical protein
MSLSGTCGAFVNLALSLTSNTFVNLTLSGSCGALMNIGLCPFAGLGLSSLIYRSLTLMTRRVNLSIMVMCKFSMLRFIPMPGIMPLSPI